MALSKGELESILNRVQQMTFAVDQKVNVLMVIQTLVLGFVLPENVKWLRTPGLPLWVLIPIWAGWVLIAIAVWHALLTVFPRIDNPTGFSVTFFGNIGSLKKVEDYRKKVAKITEEELREDYADQVYVCSVIALKKHRTFKVSGWTFVIGLCILGVTYVLSVS